MLTRHELKLVIGNLHNITYVLNTTLRHHITYMLNTSLQHHITYELNTTLQHHITYRLNTTLQHHITKEHLFGYESVKKEIKNVKEILFGCAVCVNGPVMNKIFQEPFVITLNRKTKNRNFHPPFSFCKNVKIKLTLKSDIFSGDLSLTLTEYRETHNEI